MDINRQNKLEEAYSEAEPAIKQGTKNWTDKLDTLVYTMDILEAYTENGECLINDKTNGTVESDI